MLAAEERVLVIGPGPVTLGQGPCFQYIAARGCRHLRRMGKRVLVLEDNPATLMDLDGDDGDLYMEPPAPEVIERIVDSACASAIWYGLAGRRGWLLALRLAGEDWFERLGFSAPGVEDRVTWLCGDRSLLRENLESAGIPNPAFRAVGSLREGQEAAEMLGFPLVVRPHFSSGGWGAGLAYNLEEYPLLLEDALRESPTGEVLVEEALLGWTKYVVLSLRDEKGRFRAAGVLEQLDEIHVHDADAVLVSPPVSAGGEGSYALREMAGEVSKALDLVGLAEVKLAVSPGWEDIYVIDVNPRPWRSMPLMETMLGEDLLRLHLELRAGGVLGRDADGEHATRVAGALVAVSRPAFHPERGEEGYLRLGCMSLGRRVFMAGDAAAAAAKAMQDLSRASGDGQRRAVCERLARLGSGVEARRPAQTGGLPRPEAGRGPHCLSRAAKAPKGETVMILSGSGEGADAGYEDEVNCCQALRACREMGAGTALYTPNQDFALMAAEEADAVWLGELEPGMVIEAAAGTERCRVVPHFGGPSAMACAKGLAEAGLEPLGWESLGACLAGGMVLEKLRGAGIAVADFVLSRGKEEGERALAGTRLPVLATVTSGYGRPPQRLIYSEEDGREFLQEFGREEVLWRPIREEAQEVQVEAVLGPGGCPIALLWEQVDEIGVSNCDGMAVYPPLFLTSEQSQRALELAAKAMAATGWRGNQSLRILLGGEGVWVWDMTPGSSPNLPFISRSSSLPLAAWGMMALAGRWPETHEETSDRNVVRAPLVPYGVIAGADILPSPQRRSTGSVLGVARDPTTALAKALWSEGLKPQPGGRVFLSVANREKRRAALLARELHEMGYVIMATRGTANALASAGVKVELARKLREGRPNILDFIRNGEVSLVINIPRGKSPHSDGFYIRAASARHGVPCITDMEVALALARGFHRGDPRAWEVLPLNEHRMSSPGVRGG